MHLKILLPSEVFTDQDGITSVIAETRDGSFQLLEHRLDCVAALVPGILAYLPKDNAPVYLAVDEGVLVKTGAEILVSVRRAIGGTDLGQLHDEVKLRFLALNAEERNVRDVLSRLDSGLVGRLAAFQHER
ncbi:MAG: F0F1 ATP synthase subunit epsilon [Nitrospirota bacterium]